MKAFAWAETAYAEALKKEGHKWTRRAHAGVKLERENAACDLFRLTLDEKYEKIYLNQRNGAHYDAAFVYATLPEGIGNERVKGACRKALLQAAQTALDNEEKLPYRLTSENLAADRASGFSSFCTIPRNTQLIRAHYLTGEENTSPAPSPRKTLRREPIPTICALPRVLAIAARSMCCTTTAA